jgi:chromosome segregation ATPase
VQSWLNANEAVLNEQAERVASIRRSLIPLEARQSSVSAGIRSLELEHAHLRKDTTEERASALLGGKVSLEDYFQLHPLHRAWAERYPGERLRKLTEVLEKQRELLSEVKSRIEKVSPNLSSASSQYQSALSQKNSWLAELHQHDGMCNGGCRNELCPPR